MASEKKTWEMSYEEIYDRWATKFAFGEKGELTPNEAGQVHNKWKNLGSLASRGLL